MKVAINSRTFRVDDGVTVIDYDVPKGSASSYLLDILDGGGQAYVTENIIGKYDSVVKDSTTDDFHWKSESDAVSLTNIHYTEIGRGTTAKTVDDAASYGSNFSSAPNYGNLGRFKPPTSNRGGIGIPPKPRVPKRDYTHTEKNHAGFNCMFGN